MITSIFQDDFVSPSTWHFPLLIIHHVPIERMLPLEVAVSPFSHPTLEERTTALPPGRNPQDSPKVFKYLGDSDGESAHILWQSNLAMDNH